MIVDRMTSLAEQVSQMGVEAAKSSSPSSKFAANGNGKLDRGTQRRHLEVALAPLPRERSALMEQGRVVITDDGRGVARGLETQLLAAGIPVERIGGPDTHVDWTSLASIESILEGLRSRGPLTGIVHALPLGAKSSFERMETDWSARVGVEGRRTFPAGKGHGLGPARMPRREEDHA